MKETGWYVRLQSIPKDRTSDLLAFLVQERRLSPTEAHAFARGTALEVSPVDVIDRTFLAAAFKNFTGANVVWSRKEES